MKTNGLALLIVCFGFNCLAAPSSDSEADWKECANRMSSVGLSHPQQIEWVCRNANPFTVQVIDLSIRAGLDQVDSLTFTAGGHPTSATAPCMDFLIRHTLFNRVDSVSMLCRDVSEGAFRRIRRFLSDPRSPYVSSYELAEMYSRESLESFKTTFKELKGIEFCDVVECNLP
jgi:hypothetical protein